MSLKKEQKNSIEMLCKNHLTLKPKWVKSLDGKIKEILQLLRSLRTTIISKQNLFTPNSLQFMLLSSQGGVKPFVCNSFALTRVFNFQLKQLPHLTPPQLGEEANVGVTIQARKTVEKRKEEHIYPCDDRKFF